MLAARRSSVARSNRDIGPATPFDRAVGRLQALDATPRHFERSEDIEVPDHPGVAASTGSLCGSYFIGVTKFVLLVGSVVVCVHFLPVMEWLKSLLNYIRASGAVGSVILIACYIPSALTASDT